MQADYQTFLNSLNDNYGLFLLNGFEFYGMQDDLSNISRQNIVIASDAALSHIAEKTHISPEENGITIMLPNGHKGRDQRAVDLWREMLSENYDVKVTYKNYDKAEITVFDYMGNSDIAATTPAAAVASSPIIICIDVSTLHSLTDGYQKNNLGKIFLYIDFFCCFGILSGTAGKYSSYGYKAIQA